MFFEERRIKKKKILIKFNIFDFLHVLCILLYYVNDW
ncbi:Uncharacterized protein GY17_00003983 [Cryptosporidium hominis]|uniref:Uncharacterized protein n=1 Tax=Cryptosporidium hominis TaxID=237895 RepID=A0ABX5B7G5_CRYHO|nr:Uncharacterized protein GY17_00003983 [Cryptosporidium hominis]|eukprot:PPS92090.1 Uncharacterized protein GY17_00003983 [Cryptosporidium hominis]